MGSHPTVPRDTFDHVDREDLIKIIHSLSNGGVVVSFHGKRTVQEIARKVRPRVTKIVRELCVGSKQAQADNLIIEGENLQAMVTLYKYHGLVDLIITDPPYNTGHQFRYNDKWDEDPNDPDLGDIVMLEDGSRHTKWLKVMMPRLNMMKAMLSNNGVLATCVDEHELFHFGMMLDEVFGENNRLAIINWQKTYSPKNDSSHVSTATEYVLVYAKDTEKAKTGLLQRTHEMDARYTSPDHDPYPWKSGDLTGGLHKRPEDFGIQSPFTGVMHYPGVGGRWRVGRDALKSSLEEWGTQYVSVRDPRATEPSLVLKGTSVTHTSFKTSPAVISSASRRAHARHAKGTWPIVFFASDGGGGPALKRYLKNVQRGIVPTTYWADDDYDTPAVLGAESWDHGESGHSQAGVTELNAIIGKGHGFSTVKPLKLFTKIIQLWCPPNGLVLDPYAGSGTTAHAILTLNQESDSHRRFILIEQGRPDTGDKYARSLTQKRVARAIDGDRPDKRGRLRHSTTPLPGGFEFRTLLNQIDSKAVMSMKRNDLIDVVITSHWDESRPGEPNILRLDDAGRGYLVGTNALGHGYFLIWDATGHVGNLDIATHAQVLTEASSAGLKPPFQVYARYELYQSRNVVFYKIPDKILAHLGLNEATDIFNDDSPEA
jgi:adenine-specific DNA-methyltransferase